MTILEEALQDIKEWPQVRLGQAVWNIAIGRCQWVMFLAGTYLDPFYDDTRVDAFLAHIYELWKVK